MNRQRWVDLTLDNKRKLAPEVDHILWWDEGHEHGPLFVVLKDGTNMQYEASRFYPKMARWFPKIFAQELALSLNVKFRNQKP